MVMEYGFDERQDPVQVLDLPAVSVEVVKKMACSFVISLSLLREIFRISAVALSSSPLAIFVLLPDFAGWGDVTQFGSPLWFRFQLRGQSWGPPWAEGEREI